MTVSSPTPGRRTRAAETVITRVSKTTVVIVALFALPATIAFFMDPSVWRAVAVVGHAAVTWRVAQIRLSVSGHGVTVRNFVSHTLVPLWEAEPELERSEDVLFLSDSGGKIDTEGRTLFINRPWNGSRVNVGAVPRYGAEVDRVHSELQDTILEYRKAS